MMVLAQSLRLPERAHTVARDRYRWREGGRDRAGEEDRDRQTDTYVTHHRVADGGEGREGGGILRRSARKGG